MDNDLFDFVQGYFAFGNHPQADRWAGYSEGARRGALAHARRQFDAEQAFALLVLRFDLRLSSFALWTIHGIISSEMKQTHVITSPNYALLCTLGEGDRVFMDYAAGRVALYSGNTLVSEGFGLYENERSDLELFLGTFHDPDVGRDALLYTSDLRVVAAAIRYKHECKGLLTIPEDPLPGQFIIPFRTEGEAKAYLNTLFNLKTVETSQITKASFAEWQPL